MSTQQIVNIHVRTYLKDGSVKRTTLQSSKPLNQWEHGDFEYMKQSSKKLIRETHNITYGQIAFTRMMFVPGTQEKAA